MDSNNFANFNIAQINVASIVETVSCKYTKDLSKTSDLLSDYMKANNLTPESTITCQDCIDLFAIADKAMYGAILRILTEVLSQAWFEISQNAPKDDSNK